MYLLALGRGTWWERGSEGVSWLWPCRAAWAPGVTPPSLVSAGKRPSGRTPGECGHLSGLGFGPAVLIPTPFRTVCVRRAGRAFRDPAVRRELLLGEVTELPPGTQTVAGLARAQVPGPGLRLGNGDERAGGASLHPLAAGRPRRVGEHTPCSLPSAHPGPASDLTTCLGIFIAARLECDGARPSRWPWFRCFAGTVWALCCLFVSGSCLLVSG